jgi:RNA-binding protein
LTDEAEAAPPAPNPPTLTGAQKRALRGLGHHLDAVVQIGKAGVTPGLVQATKQALLQHELIKISVAREAPVDRKEGPDALAQATGAHVAQVLGRTALLYRRRAENPAIQLPVPSRR